MISFNVAKSWRGRTLLVLALSLVIAHALAALGFHKGLPPAPWGDEAYRRGRMRSGALSLVWQPWRAPSPDAAWPAPLGRLVVPVLLLWVAGEGAATGCDAISGAARGAPGGARGRLRSLSDFARIGSRLAVPGAIGSGAR
jgi:hypothetical protein